MNWTYDTIESCLKATGIATEWHLSSAAHPPLHGAAIDSRKVVAGNIFFCIKGQQTDGHNFAEAAAQAQASLIIGERNPFAETANSASLPPVCVVPNTLQALWSLAAQYRNQTKAKVVGITGTAGKTSVKEVLAQVLATHGKTSRNPMNLNNQIGLSVSILGADSTADFWVMEVGISQAHDMDELGAILRPDLAIIINAGAGHTQGLDGKGVAYHKARLLHYVAADGAGIVNADYPDLLHEAKAHATPLASRNAALHYISASPTPLSCPLYCHAQYCGPAPQAATPDLPEATAPTIGTPATPESGAQSSKASCGTAPLYGVFQVTLAKEKHQFIAPFRGSLGAENIAVITAAARILGVPPARIQQGLLTASLPAQRLSCEKVRSFTLVDDSYNANPLSARRMLEITAEMAREVNSPLTLVMGEMRELGDCAHTAHVTLGRQMAASGATLVFWKGDHAEAVRLGLHEAEYAHAFYPIGGGQEFIVLLEELSPNCGVILFKGSRGNYLERLIDLFRDYALTPGESDAV